MVIMKIISFGMIKFQEQVKLKEHPVLWEQYLIFQRVHVLFGLCTRLDASSEEMTHKFCLIFLYQWGIA